MYEKEDLTPSEKALESALGQLKPIANTLNRDELMFNAGRASIRGKLHWQMLSGILTILLLCSVLFRTGSNEIYNVPSDSEQNSLQVVQIEYQTDKAELPDSVAYPRLRDNIVKYGLDALELQPHTGYGKPIESRRQLLEDVLSL